MYGAHTAVRDIRSTLTGYVGDGLVDIPVSFGGVTFIPGYWLYSDEDGILVAKDHETLWTKESYGNFILDLEFKVAKESNSGVFLRSGDIKNVLAALEIQVHESTDGTKYGMVGAIYDAQPPTKSMAKPVGEWNRFTITCKDSLVSVIFNGSLLRTDNVWPSIRRSPTASWTRRCWCWSWRCWARSATAARTPSARS